MGAPRHLLVTGCAGGIGRQLAGDLLARGDRVFATDLDLEALERHAVAAGWPTERSRVRRLNVADPTAWEQVLDEAEAAFGPLDVLLNVAGYLRPGWVHEAPAQEVERHLDVNAKGTIYGTQAAARRMLVRGRGHIVNVASMAALAPISGLALYSASKYAVRAFSLAAAQELRPRGVHVTVLCPDAVQTPMLDLQKDYAEAAATFSGPRLLTAAEVASAVIDDILPGRPLEYYLPASRGWLARFADLFPRTTFLLGPLLRRKGLARQQELKKSDE